MTSMQMIRTALKMNKLFERLIDYSLPQQD
jgi:hypothetical protein